MQLPDCSSAFSTSVFADCQKLIDAHIWPISSASYENWTRQFTSPQEQFFAASVLSCLNVRSRKQFEAGLIALFRGGVSRRLFPNEHDLHLSQLLERGDGSVRLVPVVCDDDPPTKSGPLVMRRLQRLLRCRPSAMVWPWRAVELMDEGKVDTIVFVDDFLGGGTQFEKFFKRWMFDTKLTSASMVYAPVTAHQQGLTHLAGLWPQLHIICGEYLGASHGFFSDEVWSRVGHETVSAQDAATWYEGFANERGIVPRSTGHLGMGSLALTYGFEHSTPNNSLPTLWYKSQSWQPLLER
ncbi:MULTISPECIES: hypothetical protein [unclassified Xanthomonas]|uniref:phosphoribosyltransferase-like protein n=1 Tax=unclassified Xanthomonas TaxID=2643310 RepID=UPI001368850B|nr:MULTISPECIES: hypothetical protein [unclassified Xanthomonas]